MSQYFKRIILFEYHSEKEFLQLDKNIQIKLDIKLKELQTFGHLKYPHSRKLTNKLYEIRIIELDHYRAIYTQIQNYIVILNIFKKKTNKTPKKEIEKSIKRLNNLRNTNDE